MTSFRRSADTVWHTILKRAEAKQVCFSMTAAPQARPPHQLGGAHPVLPISRALSRRNFSLRGDYFKNISSVPFSTPFFKMDNDSSVSMQHQPALPSAYWYPKPERCGIPEAHYSMLTRLHFLGTLALLAAELFVDSCTCTQPPRGVVMTDTAAVTRPDYDAWSKVLHAHIKPSTLRGIPVNAVDYDGEQNEREKCNVQEVCREVVVMMLAYLAGGSCCQAGAAANSVRPTKLLFVPTVVPPYVRTHTRLFKNHLTFFTT